MCVWIFYFVLCFGLFVVLFVILYGLIVINFFDIVIVIVGIGGVLLLLCLLYIFLWWLWDWVLIEFVNVCVVSGGCVIVKVGSDEDVEDVVCCD